jgi:hypothetical protein
VLTLTVFVGSDFASIQDFISAFHDLKTIVTGEGSNANLGSLNVLKRSAINSLLSCCLLIPLFLRVRDLESKLVSQGKSLEKAKIKIHNLKCALIANEGFDLGLSKKSTEQPSGEKSSPNPATTFSEMPTSESTFNRTNENDFGRDPFEKDLFDSRSSMRNSPDSKSNLYSANSGDFETALNHLFTSIEGLSFPSKRNAHAGSGTVDERLEELRNEKEKLRKMLVSQI